MAIPKFDTLFLPLLVVVADGKDHRLNDIVPAVADALHLPESDRVEKMASGKARFRNRVYWAKLYLSQAKAIENAGPGTVRITERGRDLLERHPSDITIEDLTQFPEFQVFRAKSSRASHSVRRADKDVTVTVPEDEAGSETSSGAISPPDVRESMRIQALLADIGSRMGMQVWLPRSDRSAVLSKWNDNISSLLERLPLNYDDTTLRTIEQIDVLWLKGRSIRRAFEVEHTTAVYSGILRMADLRPLQPNMDINLHIVAPVARRDKVFQELRRPVFSLLDRAPLYECCTYLSYDAVRELAAQPHLAHLNDAVVDDYAEEAGDPNS